MVVINSVRKLECLYCLSLPALAYFLLARLEPTRVETYFLQTLDLTDMDKQFGSLLHGIDYVREKFSAGHLEVV